MLNHTMSVIKFTIHAMAIQPFTARTSSGRSGEIRRETESIRRDGHKSAASAVLFQRVITQGLWWLLRRCRNL